MVLGPWSLVPLGSWSLVPLQRVVAQFPGHPRGISPSRSSKGRGQVWDTGEPASHMGQDPMTHSRESYAWLRNKHRSILDILLSHEAIQHNLSRLMSMSVILNSWGFGSAAELTRVGFFYAVLFTSPQPYQQIAWPYPASPGPSHHAHAVDR